MRTRCLGMSLAVASLTDGAVMDALVADLSAVAAWPTDHCAPQSFVENAA